MKNYRNYLSVPLAVSLFLVALLMLSLFTPDSKAVSVEDTNNQPNNVIHANIEPTDKTGQIIIPSRQTDCKDFEDAQELATFKIRVPKHIPKGFKLVSLQHVRPNLSNIPDTARNDTISALYSNGKANFTIIQGHFSGGDVSIGPETAKNGKVNVDGVTGNWVKGSWHVIEEPQAGNTSSKEWNDGTLDLGWYKNNLGYAILANCIGLEELVLIADSME